MKKHKKHKKRSRSKVTTTNTALKKTPHDATISACLIVKDEEIFLPRCLSSIRRLVDEIILVDTGSNDRTIEIAEQFGCKVFHFPWTGDFSTARNESLEKASSDWIFIIDADEEVPSDEISKYRRLVSQNDLSLISLSVYNQSLESGEVSSVATSVRLFRRKLNLRYMGIVHNRLITPDDLKKVQSDLRLLHYGYDLPRGKQNLKLERTRLLLEKQLREKPDDLFANFNMIQLLRSNQESHREDINRRIIEYADRVLESPESRLDMYYGHHLMTLYQKAASLATLRQYDEAEKCCLEALKIRPDYLDVLLTLGHIYNNTNRSAQAREYYNRFLDYQQKYNPDRETRAIVIHHLKNPHHAWFGLADIADREKETDEAIQFFQKVLETRDPYLDTYCRLGKLYLDKGELNSAEMMFKKEIVRNQFSAAARFGLGSVRERRGDRVEAINYFRRALELAPANTLMRYHLGKALLSSGHNDEGKKYLLEALEQIPSNSNLLFETANLIYAAGDIKAAADLYDRILAIKPDHADAMNNLGNCHFRSEQFEKACANYEQLVKTYPTYYCALRNLGLAQLKLGKFEEAIAALSSYTDHSPEDIDVYRVLGDICLQIVRYKESISWYEKYLKKMPETSDVTLNLSEAYRRLGFIESAKLGYRRVLALEPHNQTAACRLTELAPPEPVE